MLSDCHVQAHNVSVKIIFLRFRRSVDSVNSITGPFVWVIVEGRKCVRTAWIHNIQYEGVVTLDTYKQSAQFQLNRLITLT